MGKTSSRDRMKNEINAGSMADIAFLLLIFFLVTTTIAEDKGVLVKLPPWSNEPPENLKMNTRNVYSVLVNADNQLLVRGEPMRVEDLKNNTKLFISNPRKEQDKAEDPRKAIISLKNDRGTKYKTFLTVYNELKAAYTELRNEEAERRYGKLYDRLTKDQRAAIRAQIPLVISEAEPTSFGDEE
ncbi:MAG: biopolymer transporter ExbD [Saprospiraceae bacterium]|nr:biopolymer transporter ExbD [Saprospiraceae bacterium]